MKKLILRCSFSKYTVTVFIAEEVVDYLGNMISAADFLLMIRILRKSLIVKLLLQKKPLKLYSVGELMEIVSANTVVLNIYYLVGEYQSKTENYGELLLEVASNSFSVYIFYVQIYLKMFFNLLKPASN